MVIRTAILTSMVLMLGGATTAPAPDTRAAQTQPATQPSLSTLIRDLGAEDPAVRDRAGKSLWLKGKAAEAALHDAAASEDPEISRRATAILRDFSYGLYPDAPRILFDLLNAYRTGDFQEKRVAIGQLSNNGVAGLRILIKLHQQESDPNLKGLIEQVLDARERRVAQLMLADGQVRDVAFMLENSALDSPKARQDYAAFLYLTGKLPQKLAQLKARPITLADAPLVVALARAGGDAALAKDAAQQSNDTSLLNAVLLEQGDWKTLASQPGVPPGGAMAETELAALCMCQRFAGDEKASAATLKLLADQPRHSPGDTWALARDLFLNDAPAQAESILLADERYLEASDFLAERLEYTAALALPDRAIAHRPTDAVAVEARTVGTLHFLGLDDAAKRLLDKVAAENKVRSDFTTWVYLIGAAQDMGLDAQADGYAALALTGDGRPNPVGWLFEKMHLGDGDAATLWWNYLSQHDPQLTALARLQALRKIVRHNVTGAALDALSESARRYAVDMPGEERDGFAETVADYLAAASRNDLAGPWIARLEATTHPDALIHAGDYHADRKEWAAAANDYDLASAQDRTAAIPLYLHGWALTQSGRAKEGDAMIEAAHLLPLGDQDARFNLFRMLYQRQFLKEARREEDLILHVVEPGNYLRNAVLMMVAEEMSATGDNLAAAGLEEQSLYQDMVDHVPFNNPWFNVVIPSLIHRTRALGLIKAGQIDAALAEAEAAMRDAPGDADVMIDIVNALDKSGHKPQADAFYAEQTAVYRKLIGMYPHSGPLHNQIAWSQVMCHRESDEALANGKLAVEFEPTDTASLDTLAEVYFSRGDIAGAIAQMKRCIELEPDVARHRRQLDRFQAALHPAKGGEKEEGRKGKVEKQLTTDN